MEAGAATAPGRHARAGEDQEEARATAAKMPWWMWIAVAAIVVFCLFPFYWLINISLKTGNDLQSSSLIPPQPDARQLQGRSSRTPTSRRRCATAPSSR